MNRVLSGDLDSHTTLDTRTEALLRIAALLSVDSDTATFRWAVDLATAAGVDDDEIVSGLVTVAPIIGLARLNSSLPRLFEALDLELVDV